jgi:hypothetical protein
VRLFRIYSFEYGTLFVVRLVLFRGSGISLPKGMVRTNTRSDANPFSATIDSFVVVFQHWFAYRQGSRHCGLSQALCSLPKFSFGLLLFYVPQNHSVYRNNLTKLDVFNTIWKKKHGNQSKVSETHQKLTTVSLILEDPYEE